MYKLLIFAVIAAILPLAACNKAGSKDGKTAVASASKADGESAPDAGLNLEQLEQEEANFQQLPEEDQEFIHTTLAEMAPEYGFKFDADQQVLTGEGLPLEGLPVEMVIEQIALEARQIKEAMHEVDPELLREALAKYCQRALEELQPREAEPAPPPPQRQQQPQEADEQGRPGRVRSGGESGSGAGNPRDGQRRAGELPFADDPIGEWKSIREDSPRITTYHDEDYFSFLQVLHDGKAYFKAYRDRQMSSFEEFSWQYDKRTGKLELLDGDGLVSMAFTLRMKSGDTDTLYTEQPGSYATVVYARIGTGYPPERKPGEPGPDAGGR